MKKKKKKEREKAYNTTLLANALLIQIEMDVCLCAYAWFYLSVGALDVCVCVCCFVRSFVHPFTRPCFPLIRFLSRYKLFTSHTYSLFLSLSFCYNSPFEKLHQCSCTKEYQLFLFHFKSISFVSNSLLLVFVFIMDLLCWIMLCGNYSMQTVWNTLSRACSSSIRAGTNSFWRKISASIWAHDMTFEYGALTLLFINFPPFSYAHTYLISTSWCRDLMEYHTWVDK